MRNHDRDLLVLLKPTSLTGKAFEKQIEYLHKVLVHVECNDVFCATHQLVTRLKITSKKKAILKAISFPELKPFQFLINMN